MDLYQKNNCRQCKYYTKYYIKRGDEFVLTYCAGCVRTEKPPDLLRILFATKYCPYFEIESKNQENNAKTINKPSN